MSFRKESLLVVLKRCMRYRKRWSPMASNSPAIPWLTLVLRSMWANARKTDSSHSLRLGAYTSIYCMYRQYQAVVCNIPVRGCFCLTLNVKRYSLLTMIKSFRCKDTRALFKTGKARRFSAIKAVAERKLVILAAAEGLEDLQSPPGNRLEPLTGNREDQHSIRINKQWRVCFRWTDDGPKEVEIVDYH